MVINALAAQAQSLPANTVGRFLCTSRNYFYLPTVQNQQGAGESEFVDPPRFRFGGASFQAPAKRAAA